MSDQSPDSMSVTDLLEKCRDKGLQISVSGQRIKVWDAEGRVELAAQVVKRQDEIVYTLWGEWLDKVVCDLDEYGHLPETIRTRAREIWDSITGGGLLGADEVLSVLVGKQEVLAEITSLWRSVLQSESGGETDGDSLWEPKWLNSRKVAKWVWRIRQSSWFDGLPQDLKQRVVDLDQVGCYWVLDGFTPTEAELEQFKELYKDVDRYIRSHGPIEGFER